jgi:aromatic-L-amino-acid/L-tryptophan decarboxylase
MAEGAARVPGRGRCGADEWLLDVDDHRPRCRTQRHGRRRRAYARARRRTASNHRIYVDRGALPTGDAYRIDVDALVDSIAADRRAGYRAAIVIGNAGTVDAGAVDDLAQLADICGDFYMWLHVDGAFGALAWLVPELRPALAGLQRADSLAFDLHKWLYLPYDVGCVFVRDAVAHRGAFASGAAYLNSMHEWGTPSTCFADLGIEMTRRFRALKVWLCLKAHGLSTFAQAIRSNVEQAAHLAELVRASERLVLAAPPSLNVVCFRYDSPNRTGSELDAINVQILERLWSSGTAVISETRLAGRVALRVAVTNHRSQHEDFDVLVREVERAAWDISPGRG